MVLNTQATQGVTEGSSGSITGASLLLLGTGVNGTVQLGSPANDFATVAADTDGSIHFLNAGGLTVGTVTTPYGNATGVISGGDVSLSSVGNLAIDQAIKTGAANTLRLTSANGGVTQLSTGNITAVDLGVSASTGIALGTATNAVGNFSAANTVSGNIQLLNAAATGLTVGSSVSADAQYFTATVTGVTGTGDVSLSNTGNLIVDQALTAGPTNTVRLNSVSGGVTQLATGILSGANLGVSAANSITLSTAANNFTNTFAAATTAAGATVQFQDVAGITLGTVTAASSFPTAVTGVSTDNGAVTLVSQNGPIDLNVPIVTLPAGGTSTATVLLNSGADVTQLAAGPITAANLSVVAAGGVNLNVATNVIPGAFAASDSSLGAAVAFLDGSNFTVGVVPTNGSTTTATGVTTNNGDVDLYDTSASSLLLNQNISTGMGTIRLNAAGVTQNGGAPDRGQPAGDGRRNLLTDPGREQRGHPGGQRQRPT